MQEMKETWVQSLGWEDPLEGEMETHSSIPFFFFFSNIHIFIYLAALGLSCDTWDLVPRPGIEPRPPALAVWCLSHWTSRKVPHSCILAWKIPWTEELSGYSSWGHKESDTTEQLSTHTVHCSEEATWLASETFSSF